MDTATALANDQLYLDNHLQAVVTRLERSRGIDVLGLGVGLDLSLYYRNCLAINLTDGVNNQVFNEILALTSRSRPLS